VFGQALREPFCRWAAEVAVRADVPSVELRWRGCDRDHVDIAEADSSAIARRYAEYASHAAWADVRGTAEPSPKGALRSGHGPRYGIDHDVRWASSLAHSARAAVAVAGFLVQRSRTEPWVLFGIDVERQGRAVRPNVLRLLCPRIDREALPVRQEAISSMVVASVKEAVFKSDAAQAGRAIWDYDIVALEAVGTTGWAGSVQAIDEDRPRFHVAVHRIGSYWVAMSIALTPERFLAAFE